MAPDASWNFSPGLIAALVGYLVIYVWRWRNVRASDGPRAAPVGRLLAWCGGVLLLAVALVSPIDHLGEQVFAMHMVQHVLLLDLVPILLIVALTRTLLRPVTRRVHRIERAAGPFAHPAFAAALYITVMSVWHIPGLYGEAVETGALHAVEHLAFAGAGLLYWWHLLSPIRSRFRLGGLGPVVYMAATKLFLGLLGILLTFSPDPLYDVYERQPEYWGLTAGEDQSIAGLVMALEQSIVMGIALVVLFTRALSESEREEQRRERYEDLASAP